jgi:hypothetical protein
VNIIHLFRFEDEERLQAVDTGDLRGWLDLEEPENVARSVELMRLKYVVLMSVNRTTCPTAMPLTMQKPFAPSSDAPQPPWSKPRQL